MKYLLIMYKKERFPNIKWGIDGSPSYFETIEYDIKEVDALCDTLRNWVTINPESEYYLYKLERGHEVSDLEDIISKAVDNSIFNPHRT